MAVEQLLETSEEWSPATAWGQGGAHVLLQDEDDDDVDGFDDFDDDEDDEFDEFGDDDDYDDDDLGDDDDDDL